MQRAGVRLFWTSSVWARWTSSHCGSSHRIGEFGHRASSFLVASVLVAVALCAVRAYAEHYSAELVFDLHPQHNHAPSIVACPSGDLLVSWYRGSGERSADDVAVYGAWKPAGASTWSDPFVMADRPGFPDCNTSMMIDRRGRLWLFWPTVVANSWESCITNYRVASQFSPPGPPLWQSEGLVLLKPDDFSAEATRLYQEWLATLPESLRAVAQAATQKARERLSDKLYQRLGWQPRCKPLQLPSGRILLPLYSDTFSISIMAVSDDEGLSWYAGKPLIGFGNIQPALLRRNDGTLVAYMRDNGPHRRIRVAYSHDDGVTWTPVQQTPFPNPGSGLDAAGLENGHWVLVYNDTTSGRHSLAVSLSDDEGHTWKWTRHLERHNQGSYHYPAVIQDRDGKIHVVYSYFVEQGKSIKHAVFDEAWIRAGDQATVQP
jgi:predicted neuraminidase